MEKCLWGVGILAGGIDLIGGAGGRGGQKGFALGFKCNSLGGGLVRGLTRHLDVRRVLMLWNVAGMRGSSINCDLSGCLKYSNSYKFLHGFKLSSPSNRRGWRPRHPAS